MIMSSLAPAKGLGRVGGVRKQACMCVCVGLPIIQSLASGTPNFSFGGPTSILTLKSYRWVALTMP